MVLKLCFAACSCALASLPAQELCWKLAPGMVVEYRRECKKEDEDLAKRLRLPRLRNAPLLYQAELDAKQRQSLELPMEFRDVLRYVALDLGSKAKGGRLRYELPRIMPFGDLILLGRSRPMDGLGNQSIQLRVKSQAPQVRWGPKVYFQGLVARHFTHGFVGRLEISRQVDLERGLVLGFRASLEGKIRWPKANKAGDAGFEHVEEWRLATVHGHRDAAFEEGVRKAIQKGAEYIRKEVRGLKAKKLHVDSHKSRSYNAGRLALCLLTMVKSDMDREDPVLVAGYEELRQRKFIDTYSLGLAVMAIEALYAPARERDDLISGLIKKPRPRKPSPRDAVLLENWCKQILQNLDTRVDQAYRLRFNYVRGARFDNSVNQYALLGLYSGHLCGVQIGAGVWRAAAVHLIEAQRKSRFARLRLRLESYGEAGSEAGQKTRALPALVQPMGWSYYGRDSKSRMSYGSMTAAGLAGLTICAAGLRDLDLGAADLVGKIQEARQRGFAFLAACFSIRANCGWAPRYASRRYYYLYSLERAFELSGYKTIQDRDWYHEGAMQLLAWQSKKGWFPTEYNGQSRLESTAFGVLFLKKAALPVFSGR